ncbi:hypothetical protein CLV28_2952 [Sediminihabitans luteus]|uniref:Uncharacterized protein n=1 Tax=Sediminihabitans luteus TaxID=1138585 RepID=A0A2M9CBX2_9CELL|nr:hypothetical protein [Sediminihabitans luteus]PJJ68536.1 hypothetical protein CLV28_2952 [Sediminihabitans luteus]GII99871.1 hypothetical protein Slu03_22490 [Sediminihabitans luteus]
MRRFGYVTTAGGALVLGDPARAHVRLTAERVEHVVPTGPGTDPDGADVDRSGRTEGAFAAGLADVSAFEVRADARAVRLGAPAVVAWGAVAAFAGGILEPPGTSDLEVLVRRTGDADPVELPCHGFLGAYAAHAHASTAALLDVLLVHPATRAALDRPVDVLAALRRVPRSASPGERRESLRAALVGGSQGDARA